MARVALVTGGTRGIGHAISVALKNAGYRVAANYAGNDAAAQQFQVETGIPVFKWNVGDFAACEAGSRRSRQGSRPRRRAGQQRRHHARRHASPHDPRAVERGDLHRPRLRLQHVASGDRRHARPQVRPHHQHLVDQRPQGPDGADELLRRQGRRRTASPRRWRSKAPTRASPSTPSRRATSPPRWCAPCRRKCSTPRSCR